jgi:predicted DNA-binding transcriptional regulator YafY
LYEVQVSCPKEVAWWAMSWGSEAEVLEPLELRAYVAEEARKMVAVYESG